MIPETNASVCREDVCVLVVNTTRSILESRAADFDYVFIDTPGQIETFTWSASGQLIAESLASTFATCVCYVVDTPPPPRVLFSALYAKNVHA